MPLNEKAALGGAANLETSSQGSLDNPPYNLPNKFRKSYPRKARRAALRPCGAGDRRVVYTFPRRFRMPRHGRSVTCPGPGHSPRHSFAGDDPTVCLDYVRARLGLPAFTPLGGAPPRKPAAGTHQAHARHDSAAPIKSATVAPDNGTKASWLRAQHEPISESCPAGLKNLSNYKVLRGQAESTKPIDSKGFSGALATPGSTDPPPINEKAASGWRPGRGVSKTAMEEGETSKCKSSLPSPTLQAQAALKPEAAPSELGAAHG